jgi:hypothetical protein
LTDVEEHCGTTLRYVGRVMRRASNTSKRTVQCRQQPLTSMLVQACTGHTASQSTTQHHTKKTLADPFNCVAEKSPTCLALVPCVSCWWHQLQQPVVRRGCRRCGAPSLACSNFRWQLLQQQRTCGCSGIEDKSQDTHKWQVHLIENARHLQVTQVWLVQLEPSGL